MSSLIEGYNYDIFISYRQKDNKGDKWVSEFVEALKTELESTFKEEISVYFDINPHDGLLETHDVDASLKEKLRCLVFIPIISRTYCDPKSFAWEHEFKAFVELSSQDKYGLKVKLPNGNVASRVLPVRIHDLDQEDIKLCESVLGGVFRGVEFIYKEPGVNRSLTTKDNEEKNLNHTNYRNQINKVSLAIKEIIQGLSSEPVKTVKEKDQLKESFIEVSKDEGRISQEISPKAVSHKLLYTIAIVAILIIAGIIAYPKIFKQNTLERLRSSGERISVAVMPFLNITKDSIWNNWQDGIKDELITYLTNYNVELEVRGAIDDLIQSKGLTNYASITPSVASAISKKLDANVFISGSIKQAGDKIRINAQIIDSRTEEPLKSFQIEGQSREEENIWDIIDKLKVMIKDFLVMSKLKKEGTPDIQYFATTNSPDAYRKYINGMKAAQKKDYSTARNYFSEAIKIDTNFISAYIGLIYSYGNPGFFEDAKKWCTKLYEKRDMMKMTEQQAIWVDNIYARYFKTPEDQIKCYRQLQQMDDQQPGIYYSMGGNYNRLQEYDKAIPEFVTALDIYNKWDSKPNWAPNYTELGFAYHNMGQYKEEKELYKKAEKDFPDDPTLIFQQATLSLVEGDMTAANKYIEKYISLRKENSATDADIATNLAGIYSEADISDKAEEYYRKALTLEPENPSRMNAFAYFLINKDRDISKGLELADKELKLSPDNYNYLHTKGWGLYKQSKYQEAKDILQKSWDLRKKNAMYNHSAFLHLEAAKKAVASLK
jgi:tetratricopeptide (TPR) repeat protein